MDKERLFHLSDGQWAQIEGAFPQRRGTSGFERKISNRLAFEAVLLEREGLAHEATQALAQGQVPAFQVVGGFRSAAHALVPVRIEGGVVRRARCRCGCGGPR